MGCSCFPFLPHGKLLLWVQCFTRLQNYWSLSQSIKLSHSYQWVSHMKWTFFRKKNYLFLPYDKKFLQKCVIVYKEIYVQSSDIIASTWCLKQIHVAPFNRNGTWGVTWVLVFSSRFSVIGNVCQPLGCAVPRELCCDWGHQQEGHNLQHSFHLKSQRKIPNLRGSTKTPCPFSFLSSFLTKLTRKVDGWQTKFSR